MRSRILIVATVAFALAGAAEAQTVFGALHGRDAPKPAPKGPVSEARSGVANGSHVVFGTLRSGFSTATKTIGGGLGQAGDVIGGAFGRPPRS